MTNIHYFGLGSICGAVVVLIILFILHIDNIVERKKHEFMLRNGFVFRASTTSAYESFEYWRDYDRYCIPEKYIMDANFYKLKKRYKIDKKQYKKYLENENAPDIRVP